MIHSLHIDWINQHVGMDDLLVEAGVEVSQSGKMFCPFHKNINTPAAKYFPDKREIYCFAELRTYKTYDLMRLLGYGEEKILSYIPKDFILDVYIEEGREVKFPKVKKEKVEGMDIFQYLQYLDMLWKDKDNVECCIIR